jgi:hypothetical protein
MKTLIILSAFLLALSSCTKDMPVPDSYPDPVYSPDPYPDPDPAPDPGDDDSGDDDGSCYNNHPGSTVSWMMATNYNQVG